MQAFGVLLLILAVAGSAQAQGRVLRAKSGAEIPIPPGFDPLDRAELAGGDRGDSLEAAYQRGTGERAVVLMVLKVAIENVNLELAELPRRSGPLPQHFADDLAAVMHKRWGDTRLYTEVVPLQYDHTRHAFGVELRTRGESPARALLLRPDDSAEWKQITETGADPGTVRCILRSMAGAFEAGAPERAPADAARDCSVSAAIADSTLKQLTPALFQRVNGIERMFQILTARGITIVKLEALTTELPQLEEAWKAVWTETQIAPEARPSESFARRLAILKDRPGNLLHAALGSFTLVLGLAFVAGLGLWRLRLPVLVAAILAHGLVLGLILKFSASDTREGELTATGLIRIAVSLMALPVTALLLWQWDRWWKARRSAAAPASDPADAA